MATRIKGKSAAEKLAELPNRVLVNELVKAAQRYGSCSYVIDPLEGSFRNDAQKYAQEVLRRLEETKENGAKRS